MSPPSQVEFAADILIVDDTPDNIRLLSSMLLEQGYKVRKAINGERALQAVKAVAPDLILLDIMMPEMTGYEVCERLKGSEQTRDIPVIFVSALDDVFDKVLAFDVGGADYIAKPFRVQEVVARVNHQLTLCQQKKHLETQNEQLQQALQDRQKVEVQLQSVVKIVSQDIHNSITDLSLVVKDLLKTSLAPDAASVISVPIEVLTQISDSCDQQVQLIQSVVERRTID